MKNSLPCDEEKLAEKGWERFKKTCIAAALETCFRSSQKRRQEEVPWWNEGTKTAVKHEA
jgi:hypothetical protein